MKFILWTITWFGLYAIYKYALCGYDVVGIDLLPGGWYYFWWIMLYIIFID